MTALDAEEYERWARASLEQADQARLLAQGGHHAGAVLHAEQAVQLRLKGLLRGVGRADLGRGHDLSALAAACVQEAAMTAADTLLAALRRLERDYLPTRYPDALPGGTPGEKYDDADSGRALDAFALVDAAVQDAWGRLRVADGEEGDP